MGHNLEPKKVREQKLIREFRMTIVAKALKRGMSLREIVRYVTQETGNSVSLNTIQRDTKILLTEWRDSRLKDFSLKKEQELTEISNIISECWDQWDKSKTDQKIQSQKQKGEIQGGVSSAGEDAAGNTVVPLTLEKTVKNEVWLGDVRYLAEIRAQQQERRKLEGLYAPEQTENVTTVYNVDLTEDDVKLFKKAFEDKY